MSLALILANPQAAADGFAWECAYVRGISHDFKVLRSFFGDVGIPLSPESGCFTGSLRKQESCDMIERFFQEQVEGAYILVLASHGAPVGGAIASTREGWLRFEDVMRLWLISGHGNDCSKMLFILLDCCHSGFWVNKAAKLRCPNVVVQAACSDVGQSVADYDADCGPDTSFICKWVIEQRWQPSPVLFVLPQDPRAVSVARLDVQKVGWKFSFVTRRKHPLRVINAVPVRCFDFLKRQLLKLELQAQLRLLMDLTAESPKGPTASAWHQWRFRPVLEELLERVQRPLMRKEALLMDQCTCGVFQEVRDFMACSQWDDASSCQARLFATWRKQNKDVWVEVSQDVAVSDNEMAFEVQWHFRHYYVGAFDLALQHLTSCLENIKQNHEHLEYPSSLKALVFAWMAANWRNKAKACLRSEDVEHSLREAYRCISEMNEAADNTQMSPLVAAEVSLICGCWKADAAALGKAALVGDLLGESVEDLRTSLKKEVERGISCCCQASWYDGYLNNTLTLCHIELLHSQASQDANRVENLLCAMPFEVASRRTQHKRNMYLAEARIRKLEFEETKLFDEHALDGIRALLSGLLSAFDLHKEKIKCKQLEERLRSVVARQGSPSFLAEV